VTLAAYSGLGAIGCAAANADASPLSLAMSFVSNACALARMRDGVRT